MTQVSMDLISHSIGATALEDVRRPYLSLEHSAIHIWLIGFILPLQMRKKKENPRKKKTMGPETDGALTPAPGKQIHKGNFIQYTHKKTIPIHFRKICKPLLVKKLFRQPSTASQNFSSIRVSISNARVSNQWRKDSLTIVESQEPMEEDNEVGRD